MIIPPILTTSLYISLLKVGRMFFLSVGVKELKIRPDNHTCGSCTEYFIVLSAAKTLAKPHKMPYGGPHVPIGSDFCLNGFLFA